MHEKKIRYIVYTFPLQFDSNKKGEKDKDSNRERGKDKHLLDKYSHS